MPDPYKNKLYETDGICKLSGQWLVISALSVACDSTPTYIFVQTCKTCG
jgi:hypothetical protein